MRDIVVIAHNIRSTHNIGSLFRTCDGLGISKLYITGYSPYPRHTDDTRLPHISDKLTKQINKTALGAEESVSWHYDSDPKSIIDIMRSKNYQIIGLEQTPQSVSIVDFAVPSKIVLLLGEELDGINNSLQMMCDGFIEIPMQGHKESFNVSVAAAMALYHFKFSR